MGERKVAGFSAQFAFPLAVLVHGRHQDDVSDLFCDREKEREEQKSKISTRLEPYDAGMVRELPDRLARLKDAVAPPRGTIGNPPGVLQRSQHSSFAQPRDRHFSIGRRLVDINHPDHLQLQAAAANPGTSGRIRPDEQTSQRFGTCSVEPTLYRVGVLIEAGKVAVRLNSR